MAARQPVAPPAFSRGRVSRPSREELLAAPIRWPRPELAGAGVAVLPGIGPALAARAAAAGVETVGDLLWRVPRAVDAPPGTVPLAELEPGETGIVAVTVERACRVRTRRGRPGVVEARVRDDSGSARATWFNQPWIIDRLKPGGRFLLEGRRGPKGLTVSAAEPLGGTEGLPAGDGSEAGTAPDSDDGTGPGNGTGPGIRWNSPDERMPPGLSPGDPRVSRAGGGEIGAATWRRWAFQACRAAGGCGDPVPASLLTRHGYPGAAAAFREAHFPEGEERARLATGRLAWEELLLYRAMLWQRRSRDRDRAAPAIALDGPDRTAAEWIAALPFRLTGDQRRAIEGLREELAGEVPMRRLLMGEVGSGKTVVALAAVMRAAASGAQSALMAPTGVLAEQHAATIAALAARSGLRVALLTGATPAKARKSLLEQAAGGGLDLLVGTHALLEYDVRFHRLGLSVIDEEHRFGVRQRSRLEARAPAGRSAHLLHMSATPIPRTLSLTAYGDLDVTTLRELPAGRRPVETVLSRESGRGEVFRRVREELDRGRQGFVVCPLVEESEELEARAAETEAARLAAGDLSGYEVGLIHGRMRPGQKERAMAAFLAGKIQVLVATTVIEVGVDVPNATVMVIEGAERFGLSQLHQLRGRIGRGRDGGTCFLLPAGGGSRAGRRLAELARETDGFRLAGLDLEMRGEGEIAGTRQHGLPRFRVASLPRDADLLEAAAADLDRLAPGPGLELLAAAGEQRFAEQPDSGGEGRVSR